MILGSSFLTISTPFVVSECLKKIGLSNTFYVLAAFALISALLTLTFKPQLKINCNGNFFERIRTSLKVLKMKKCLIWIIGVFIGFFGYLIPILVIVK